MAHSGDLGEIRSLYAGVHEDPADGEVLLRHFSVRYLLQITVCLSQLIPGQVCEDSLPRTFSHNCLSITDTPA